MSKGHGACDMAPPTEGLEQAIIVTHSSYQREAEAYNEVICFCVKLIRVN